MKKTLSKLSDDIINTLDSNKTFTHLSTIVKELIENSIDAKASKISIKLLKGGLELIEVKDDGVGMSKETLEKLCLRFTSTKIESYNDLSSLETFGFRGEALSILSYISTLTIISRDKNSEYGYQAVFINGKMDQKNNIKSIVCNVGTVIQVQNIFYNNPIRTSYFLKNKNDELEDIINTAAKLAFHFINISFSLCTDNNRNSVFITTGKNNNTDIDELELRKNLANKLFNQDLSDGFFKFDNDENDENGLDKKNSGIAFNLKTINNTMKNFKFVCYHTKPSNYIKKSKLIIFINNRLVKINSLKKIFQDTYNKFLIKKGNFFAYLSISCPPELLDVNVKANKSEVFFQNEEQLLENFGNLLESVLREEINSKNYYAGEYKGFNTENKKQNEILFDENKDKKNIYAKDKIRVDNKNISIERYLALKKIDSKQKPRNIESNEEENMDIENDNNNSNFNQINLLQKKIDKENQLCFANIILKEIYQNLFLQEKDINDINTQKNKPNDESDENKDEIEEDENKINYTLNNIFKQGTYIGYIKNNFFITLQYQTSMYLINTRVLLQEYFFYQILISYDGNNSYVENISLSSEFFSLEKLFSFISEQFNDNIEKKNHADIMLQKIDYIKSNIIPTTKILTKGIIEFDEKDIISGIKMVNFFKNDKFIVFCLDYIPLIYFSIVEHIYFFKEEKSNIQENKNINCIIDLIKIISYYYALAYVEFLKKENEEFINIFFRDIILYDIKADKNFLLRKKLKPQEIYEKLIDTETLYTVFERC
jgi:DNA mismatch repair protein MLH1